MSTRVPLPQATPYQRFKEKWKSGCGSNLCSKAHHVVLSRGQIPCDILFVGEAPGASENLLGVPFKGPAGHRLDQIVEQTFRFITTATPRLAYTNLVGCIPYEEGTRNTTEPDWEDIETCKPRLIEFIGLASPKLLVCVGKISEKAFEKGVKSSIKVYCPIVNILHPGYILLQPIAAQSMMIRKAAVDISTAWNKLTT